MCAKRLALVGGFTRGVERFMVAWHSEEKKASRLRATIVSRTGQKTETTLRVTSVERAICLPSYFHRLTTTTNSKLPTLFSGVRALGLMFSCSRHFPFNRLFLGNEGLLSSVTSLTMLSIIQDIKISLDVSKFRRCVPS